MQSGITLYTLGDDLLLAVLGLFWGTRVIGRSKKLKTCDG